jgi:hypothetical protein
MHVAIRTNSDGSMHFEFDEEAACAMLASVRFASQFHAGIAALARITDERLKANERLAEKDGRTGLCH